MSTKTTLILSAALILAAILAGVLLGSQLPDPMASHWNEADQVDGYMPRVWGTFMIPLMMTGLTLLFLLIPVIDPLKRNVAEFRGWFDRADLVIAKGQGNYETLSDTGKDVFFLLTVKCPAIAADIGAPVGSLVVKRRRGDGAP